LKKPGKIVVGKIADARGAFQKLAEVAHRSAIVDACLFVLDACLVLKKLTL